MKNILVLLLMATVSISCNNSNESESTKHSQIQLELKFLMTVQEYLFMEGDMNTTKLWETYIKAHNEKDLETIKNINDDAFKGYPPNGDVIDGSEAHIGFLEEWFTNSSPKVEN